MDVSMLAPELARLLGINPATLVLLIFVANRAGAIVARSIPNDAVGFWGFVRQLAAIVGTEVPSKLTKGVTVADAAKAAIQTPPITQKVEQATGAVIPDEYQVNIGNSDENYRISR